MRYIDSNGPIRHICETCRYNGSVETEHPCSVCEKTVGSVDMWELDSDYRLESPGSCRAKILHDAERYICGHREQDYGLPESNVEMITALWTIYTGQDIDSASQTYSTSCSFTLIAMATRS